MQALISLLFAPWWVFAILAGGSYVAGDYLHGLAAETDAALVAAAKTPVPDVVNLSDFDRDTDVHLADEVHISGWIDLQADYHLTKSDNGVVQDQRFMYLLFGQDDSFEEREVRAILMLTADQETYFYDNNNDFIDWTAQNAAGQPRYTFNGFWERTDSFNGMADDAIAELGLTRASDAFYIEPFFDGREAALVPTGHGKTIRDGLRFLAMIFGGLGLLKFALRMIKSRGASAGSSGSAPQGPVADNHQPAAFSFQHPAQAAAPSVQAQPSAVTTARTPFAPITDATPVPPVKAAAKPSLHGSIMDRLGRFTSYIKIGILVVIGIPFLFTMMPSTMGAIFPFAVVCLVMAGVFRTQIGTLIADFKAGRGTQATAKGDPFDRLRSDNR